MTVYHFGRRIVRGLRQYTLVVVNDSLESRRFECFGSCGFYWIDLGCRNLMVDEDEIDFNVP